MLTKNIQLKPAWQKKYNKSCIIVFALFFLLLIFFSHKILFPSEFRTYSFQEPDSKENSIFDVSASKDNLIFNTIATKDFSVAEIKIITQKNSFPLTEKSISAKKSYLAFFYPQGEDITNPNEFEINSLVSDGSSVFIVGNGKKYPINNPETFEANGFKWENLKSSEHIDLSEFEKQSLFNIRDAHPDGTIMKIKETGKFFLIKDGQKHELKGEALKKQRLEKEAILAEQENDAQEKCHLSKSFLRSSRYKCTMSVEDVSEILGGNYRFNLEDISNDTQIQAIHVEFKRKCDTENLKRSIKEILNKILLRYNIKIENQ